MQSTHCVVHATRAATHVVDVHQCGDTHCVHLYKAPETFCTHWNPHAYQPLPATAKCCDSLILFRCQGCWDVYVDSGDLRVFASACNAVWALAWCTLFIIWHDGRFACLDHVSIRFVSLHARFFCSEWSWWSPSVLTVKKYEMFVYCQDLRLMHIKALWDGVWNEMWTYFVHKLSTNQGRNLFSLWPHSNLSHEKMSSVEHFPAKLPSTKLVARWLRYDFDWHWI